jgi:hypothetical protein
MGWYSLPPTVSTCWWVAVPRIGQQRNQGSRATSGAPTFELKYEGSHEYDPSYYHLRNQSPPVGGLRYPHVGSQENIDSDVLSLLAAALPISLDKKDKSNVYLVNVLFC